MKATVTTLALLTLFSTSVFAESAPIGAQNQMMKTGPMKPINATIPNVKHPIARVDDSYVQKNLPGMVEFKGPFMMNNQHGGGQMGPKLGGIKPMPEGGMHKPNFPMPGKLPLGLNGLPGKPMQGGQMPPPANNGNMEKPTFPTTGNLPPGLAGITGAHGKPGIQPRPVVNPDGQVVGQTRPAENKPPINAEGEHGKPQIKPAFNKPAGPNGALMAKHSIEQGIRTGELTKEEVETLVTQQKEIAKTAKDARSDGKFTEEEQKALLESIKNANKAIHDAKTNTVRVEIKKIEPIKAVETNVAE